MNIRLRRLSLLAGALLGGFGLARCAADDPTIVGTWRNGTNQILVVGPDLRGRLTQEAECSPTLDVTIRRDPYDAYAIRFAERQLVFFPVAQRENFGANEYFCTSKDSVPMCAFCRVEGPSMACRSPSQKITGGTGGSLTHDCNWMRVETSSTSTTTSGCTDVEDRSGVCGTGSPDAGVGDAGP